MQHIPLVKALFCTHSEQQKVTLRYSN